MVHASAISADPNKTASPASGLVGAGSFDWELLLSILLKNHLRGRIRRGSKEEARLIKSKRLSRLQA